MPFSARKMHFFEKNGNLTTCSAQLSADIKELFFWKVILHQFLKRKNWALLSKNVQAILTLFNLAQKVPFLEDLKKKFLDIGAGLGKGANCHFSQKNAFFGQKKAFFQKVHFIQNVQWPKIQFFGMSKKDFVIQSKVSIFHQIQPSYEVMRKWGHQVIRSLCI